MSQEIRHWIAIAGKVIDADTQQAIANAQIHIQGENLPILPGINEEYLRFQTRTQTDTDGSFYLIDLPAGSYTLNVTFSHFNQPYRPHSQSVVVSPKKPDKKAEFDWIAVQLFHQV